MAAINWALYTEPNVGRGHPSLADVVNRPLRQVLTLSGMDPDADFTGLAPSLSIRGCAQFVSSATPVGGFAALTVAPNGDPLPAGFGMGGYFGPMGDASNAPNGLAGVCASTSFAPGTYTIQNVAPFVAHDVATKPPGVTITTAYAYFSHPITSGLTNWGVFMGGAMPNWFGGQVRIAAGTTAQAPLNLAPGVAPTTPVDGDIWTTASGTFVRINGVTKSINLT